MSLTEKSFKELNGLVEKVAEKYFEAKQMALLKMRGELIAEIDTPYDIYLYKVERAYAALDPREKNLINNEFFFQNYRDWWIGLYSKASFYRFKKQAMHKFLEAFRHA